MTKSKDIVDQIVQKANLIISELRAMRREFKKHHEKYLRSKKKNLELSSL